MSLKPLQATMPLGQYDVLDAQLTSFKGGEVVHFGSVVATAATDKAASDVFDGYINPNKRAVVQLATDSADTGPFMLADDGITGYGTLFGTVVGGTVGQVSTGGAVLGPHTATGSGKLTCWAAPGLFAVSLDAVSSNLQPTSASNIPGAALTYTDAGLLTRLGAGDAEGTVKLGNLVEFTTNGSLVTTPNTLAGTFNPPDGTLTTTAKVPTYVVFWFNPASV